MEQLPKEHKKAWQAFQDFIKLGENRDLKALTALYKERSEAGVKPPTLCHGTLRNWSSMYDWAERADAYDAEQAIITAHKVKAEEEAKHVKQLKAFRQAGDMAAVASMTMASQILTGNTELISQLLKKMQLPESPTPKDSLEILMVIEKAQAIAEKAIEQKSKIEGFDKIAKFLEANGN